MPRLSLRGVIAAAVCLVVLIVAASTLTISYTMSLATVRDLGANHATTLATTAQKLMENYFLQPVRHVDTLAEFFSGNPEYDLPSVLPLATQDNVDYHKQLRSLLYGCFRGANYSYMTIGFVFDDGSGVVQYHSGNGTIFALSRFYGRLGSGGNMSSFGWEWNTTTGAMLPTPPMTQNVDARFSLYATAKNLVGASRRGLWFSVVMYQLGTLRFVLPCVKPLYNHTGGFIGFVSLVQPLDAISGFLSSLRATPNTEAFAVETTGALLGSTHATPHFTITAASPTAPVRSGCSSSAATSYDPNATTVYHGCRLRAADFAAYVPLQMVASDRGFVAAATMTVRFEQLGGDNYFVVSAPVRNPYAFWGVNVLVFMPEVDVIGDIMRSRNIAIGVTAGVFVVAAVLAVVLVNVLLAPLATVSEQMRNTARLRDVPREHGGYSAFQEVHDLQRAYSNMNTAISSFTRYVPRDVVKDLMASGQLCQIQMEAKACTMLFVDIEGFTTMCERVPPDVLPDLVTEYFERMSSIVMKHDGLIDKYIGDCIMAVWGAPFCVANHEVKAVLAGKLIDRATLVDPLAAQWDGAGEVLRVRVGIATGDVLAGNMGSSERMNYTVIGDSVNLAARVESLNKQFGTRVMVTEATAAALGGVFVLRLLARIAVVGKTRPVKVFEVVGATATLDPLDAERLEAAESAISSDDVETTLSSSMRSVADVAATPAARQRHKRSAASTVALLREAARETAATLQPLAATADERAFAVAFTEAVLCYVGKNFSGALDKLDSAVAAAPAGFVDGKPGAGPLRSSCAARSVDVLRSLCDHCLTAGCGDDFDGVMRTGTK